MLHAFLPNLLFRLVDGLQQQLQSLELRVTFEVRIARLDGIVLAGLHSSLIDLTTLPAVLLHFDGESLVPKFVGTLLTVEQLFPFNVDAEGAFLGLMVLAVPSDYFDGLPAPGSLPGMLE